MAHLFNLWLEVVETKYPTLCLFVVTFRVIFKTLSKVINFWLETCETLGECK